jgi:hypothetical protein
MVSGIELRLFPEAQRDPLRRLPISAIYSKLYTEKISVLSSVELVMKAFEASSGAERSNAGIVSKARAQNMHKFAPEFRSGVTW